MRTATFVLAGLLALAATPAQADNRGDAKKQVEFGIAVAQKGLWREAIYRWERATQIDPSYAAALNNLAIAYEHEGELAKARSAYEKARRAHQLFERPRDFQYFGSVLHSALHDPDEAERVYREGLALDPNHVGILSGLIDL